MILNYIRKFIVTTSDQESLNAALAMLQTWCEKKWQMIISYKKTVAMRDMRKKQPLLFTYNINGHALSKVTKHKYLGLLLTSDFVWNEHIEYVKRKAMKTLGYLRRRLANTTPHIKLLAYKTLIRPVLECGAAVWDPFTQSNIKRKLEMVQTKFVRFVFDCYSRRTSPSLFLKAELKKLQKRRMERLKLFYFMFNNKIGINKTVHITQTSEGAVHLYH